MTFPTSQLLYIFKNNLYENLKFSLKLQFSERNAILKFQNEKFIKLLHHAKKNVPYYSEILNGINDINDLAEIPFLTKHIVKERNNDLKATNIPLKHFVENSTSGSTGESMHFFSYKPDDYSEACAIRGDMLTGWKYGEKKVIVWGASRDLDLHEGFKQRLIKKYIHKFELLSSFNLSIKDIGNYINQIKIFEPSIIIGYPTALFLIAEYIIDNDLSVNIPKGVISAGETLYDFQRTTIEKAFHQKVFNRYGCRDVFQIASECSAHNGLHVSADHLIVEIINDSGKVALPGEMGEIVVTDLDNYAFPMIRYKIGDIGVLKDPEFECGCGVKLPMLEKVEGRTMDVVVGTNGNRVSGNFWTLFFRHEFEGIEKFQVFQEDINIINLFFEVNAAYNSNSESKIKKEIRLLLGDEIDVNISVVDEIIKTETGKHRWIISNVSPYAR